MNAYICAYLRTPFGRFGGSLSGVRADDLAAIPIRALTERHADIDWSRVDDVILGCANQAGEDNRNVARMALLLAGLPETVPGGTINRLCGSGLDAVSIAARAIGAGEADLVIAGGVESMSRAPLVMSKADRAFARTQQLYDTTIGWRFINPLMDELYGTDSMPETGENVAAEFSVSREDQDAFACRSHQRAVHAQATGRLAREIVPVTVAGKKRGQTIVVDSDEHPRADTSIEKLAALPAPFRAGGTVTAGNASGVNDGAVALLVASDTAVKQWDLQPLCRIAGGTVAGVSPRIMGMGPAPATRNLCERLHWQVRDIDLLELNEAFASQSLAVLRELGMADDAEHVNPNGGAIALGHPLGASGARLAGTLATELHERGAARGIATMCIGVGQGIALGLEAA